MNIFNEDLVNQLAIGGRFITDDGDYLMKTKISLIKSTKVTKLFNHKWIYNYE